MGKLLDIEKLINRSATNMMVRTESQVSKFVDGFSPVFMTYFSVNKIATTIDDSGFGSIDELLGNDSPIRYNKINSFVGLMNQKIDFNMNSDDDKGIDIQTSCEMLIIPNTISPTSSDLIIIEYVGKKYLFKVDEFHKDTLRDNNYYNITFTLYRVISDMDIIDKQVVEEYTMIYENINTTDKFLIKQVDYDISEKILSIYDVFRTIYIENYYDRRFNSFIYSKEEHDKIYDMYLTEFMKRNSLFINPNNLNSIYVNVEIVKDANFTRNYLNSVYNNIEKCDKGITYNSYMEAPIHQKFSVFDYGTYKFSILLYNNEKNAQFNTLIQDKFIDNIVKNEMYPDDIVKNIIIKYFNNAKINNNDIINLDKYIFDYNFENYYLIPIMMFILRQYIII